MKALALVMLVLLAGTTYAGDGEEIKIKKMTASVYNDVWKRFFDKDLDVHYYVTADSSSTLIYLEDTLGTACVEFDEKGRIDLDALLAKFEEWKKKAAAKKTKLEKQIGVVESSKAFFVMGDDFTHSDGIVVTVDFFTQPSGQYQCILSFSKMQDKYNEYKSHDTDARYLSASQVAQLRKALNKDTIEKAVIQHTKKMKEAEEFK